MAAVGGMTRFGAVAEKAIAAGGVVRRVTARVRAFVARINSAQKRIRTIRRSAGLASTVHAGFRAIAELAVITVRVTATATGTLLTRDQGTIHVPLDQATGIVGSAHLVTACLVVTPTGRVRRAAIADARTVAWHKQVDHPPLGFDCRQRIWENGRHWDAKRLVSTYVVRAGPAMKDRFNCMRERTDNG